MIIAYGLILFLFSIYSYVLIDPNLTFFTSPIWAAFREAAVNIGYYQRPLSTALFFIFIAALYLFHWYFTKRNNSYDPVKLSILIALLLLISYPFLSHDLFNYMFDAKIITIYHNNPYIMRAMDFNHDPWLRFMQWIHRTTPYGPVFIAYSVIPSFLSMGKFILDFMLFKAFFSACYIGGVYALSKINKKSALFFATQPLILVEGLVSSHNDIVGVGFALLGIYLMLKTNKRVLSYIFLLGSGLIKYITLPLLILTKKNKHLQFLSLIGVVCAVLILSFKYEIQPWYFLSIFIFIPFYFEKITKLSIFFAGLIASYYPYIFFDEWVGTNSIYLKHLIIFIFFSINIFYLIAEYAINRKRVAVSI